MKTLKRILKWFFILVITCVTVIFIWKPYLLRVLRYRTPNAETYKIFPQAFVLPGDAPFLFKRALKMRTDLDSLHVFNGQNQSIRFDDYFKQGKLTAFIVIRNDSIIYQKFADGYADSTLTTIFSGAKSFISIMIGQALAEGDIKSLNDKVIDYIPELRTNTAFHHISIKNLLDMKSGLAFQDAFGGFIKAFFSDEAKYYYTSDMKAELMNVKLVNAPGTVWKYKSIDPILLGWVLESATKRTVAQYFQEKVWVKIGSQYKATWGLDHHGGLANTASRFQVTAIDLAKIGRLFLNDGNYDGQQVVTASWIRQSVNIGNEKPSSAKGWQKSAHHYLWWIPQEGEKGDYAAEGMLGQRLYIDPKTNTIIVQLANHGAGDYPYRKISRYLAGKPFTYPNR